MWFSALVIAKHKKSSKRPMQAPSHIKSETKEERETHKKDLQRINSSKKRSVAEATMYECYGIEPRRYMLGP
jgi:hypothetical protein